MALSSRALRFFLLLSVVFGLFGCDHATKIAAKATLEGASAMPIAPSVLHGAVELRYVENTDMAFNALQFFGIPRSPTILIAMSLVALVSITLMFFVARRSRSRAKAAASAAAAAAAMSDGDSAAPPSSSSSSSSSTGRFAFMKGDRTTQAGLALIVGGALGNLVDRIARGYVVDFIHVKGWPVFNVADIAVVVGMMLMAWGARARRRQQSDPPSPPPLDPPPHHSA